jgi:hypothetical protein
MLKISDIAAIICESDGCYNDLLDVYISVLPDAPGVVSMMIINTQEVEPTQVFTITITEEL